MATAKIEIPYEFLNDLQSASAVLEVMMEDCEDPMEAMNLWSAQCEIDRIIAGIKEKDGNYAYTYERR